MKRRAIIIILLMISVSGYTQSLEPLVGEKLNKKLVEIAKSEYSKAQYKEFFREYGTPTIVKKTLKKPLFPDSLLWGTLDESKAGDVFYVVEFPYDLNKERFEYNYAAQVYIWERTGKACFILLGDGIGKILKTKTT